MKEANTIGWYLVFTKPNQENTAKINLERQGFQTYLPMLQQHKRKRNLYQIVSEPLFPRYIFIALREIDDWSKIRSTRGCVSLVRFGALPARVPNELISRLQDDEPLRSMENENTTPEFKPGDRVQVVSGILSNYEGIVAAKNSQQRITLLLNVAEGYTHRIDMSVHMVAKI